MTKWEILCKSLLPLYEKKVDEITFQKQFISDLKTVFNWEDKNIQENVTVPCGRDRKFADIVLKHDDFGIVIEMKEPGLKLGRDEEYQTLSYMKILGYRYALLVGEKILMFYDDDERKIKKIAEIGYSPNNNDGIELGEILDHKVCSNEKLKKYISARIAGAETIQLEQNNESEKNSDIHKSQVKKLKEIGSIFNNTNKELRSSDVTMGNSPYIQILVQNWPEYLHYEFFSRIDRDGKEYIGIEFHFENPALWESSGAKETFEEFNGITIANYTIERTPFGRKGIYIKVPSEKSVDEIVSLMNNFIELTINKVNEKISM